MTSLTVEQSHHDINELESLLEAKIFKEASV